MGPSLQVEALVHVELLLEPQEWDGERRYAADLAGQWLVGGRPVDIREPVDEKRKNGDDADQEKESTIDAHARESIGEP